MQKCLQTAVKVLRIIKPDPWGSIRWHEIPALAVFLPGSIGANSRDPRALARSCTGERRALPNNRPHYHYSGIITFPPPHVCTIVAVKFHGPTCPRTRITHLFSFSSLVLDPFLV